MIFVSAGTQFPFDRFIEIIDNAVEGTNEEVVAQAIPGKYIPRNFKLQESIPSDKFSQYVNEARLVIAHAGMGIILTAMLKQKPIVIFPRRGNLHEHRNDHQADTARRFEELNYVHVAWDAEALRKFICDPDLKNLHTVGPNASTELTEHIQSIIDSL